MSPERRNLLYYNHATILLPLPLFRNFLIIDLFISLVRLMVSFAGNIQQKSKKPLLLQQIYL